MNIIKIDIQTIDTKYGNTHASLCAMNLEAAVKYLYAKYDGIEDCTDAFLERHPHWIGDADCPVKIFKFTKERVDEDGNWDYPAEYAFTLYWEGVIE